MPSPPCMLPGPLRRCPLRRMKPHGSSVHHALEGIANMKTLPPIAPAPTSAACGHLAAAPLDVGHGRDCRGPSGRPVDRCTVRARQAYQMGRVNWADTRLLQQSGICASTSRSSPAGGACSAARELTDTAFDCPPAPAWCTVCLRCLAITLRDAGLQRVRPVCASWAPVCPLTAAWGRVAAGTGLPGRACSPGIWGMRLLASLMPLPHDLAQPARHMQGVLRGCCKQQGKKRNASPRRDRCAGGGGCRLSQTRLVRLPASLPPNCDPWLLASQLTSWRGLYVGGSFCQAPASPRQAAADRQRHTGLPGSPGRGGGGAGERAGENGAASGGGGLAGGRRWLGHGWDHCMT